MRPFATVALYPDSASLSASQRRVNTAGTYCSSVHHIHGNCVSGTTMTMYRLLHCQEKLRSSWYR